MGTHTGLMRVFWPSDAPRSPLQGVLVGFRNSESDVFVVAILHEVEVQTQLRDGTEHTLTLSSSDMSTTLLPWAQYYETVHMTFRSFYSDAVIPLFARLVS
jgi:hypothetical protein